MSNSANNHYGNMYENDPYVRRRFEAYFRLLKTHLGPETEILDIGGYRGDFLFHIKKRGISDVEYTVFDYDDSALKTAKERGARTIKADLNYSEPEKILGDKKYDVVICTEVLEHLLEPEKYMKFISSCLKPDGIALVSLPNENTVFHRIYAVLGMGIDQCAFEPHKHLHFPTIKQSRKFVSQYMKIEKEKYYINLGGAGSRFDFMAKFLQIFPDSFWQKTADTFPRLIARGAIFKLRKK